MINKSNKIGLDKIKILSWNEINEKLLIKNNNGVLGYYFFFVFMFAIYNKFIKYDLSNPAHIKILQFKDLYNAACKVVNSYVCR